MLTNQRRSHHVSLLDIRLPQSHPYFPVLFPRIIANFHGILGSCEAAVVREPIWSPSLPEYHPHEVPVPHRCPGDEPPGPAPVPEMQPLLLDYTARKRQRRRRGGCCGIRRMWE